MLAIPAAVGLFVWLLVTLVPHEHDHAARIVTMSLFILLLISWTVVLRRHGLRVLVRAGVFPNWCSADRYPRDEVELRQAVLDLRQRAGGGKYPSIVGGGWAFFLKRRGPPSPRVFTHNFKGIVPGETNRFYAGTTIHAVNKHFLRSGKTLASHPTMDFISIGSWVSCANHGNDGDALATPAIDTVTVLDMADNATRRVRYAEARRLFDTDFEGRFCVLDVSFNVVDNRTLQKRGLLVADAQSAADWLAPGAHLRLLFLGAAREYGIGLRWERPYDDDSHIDPHCCSRFCQFLQVDVFSAVCGCHEPMEKFNGKMPLYEANRWTPPIYPIMNLALIFSGLLNFEVMFKLDNVLDGYKLFKYSSNAIQMHQRVGGRSEIRYAKANSATTVFWDVSLRRRHFHRAFELLHHTLGVERVAIHPGKCGVRSTLPCSRVLVSDLETF